MTRREATEATSTTEGEVKQRRTRRPKIAAAPNFGSIDLVDLGQIGPNWTRNAYDYADPMIARVVGHANGVPDVCLKNDPGKFHQFCWGTPKNEVDLNRKFQQGYDFVKLPDGWVKNVKIWQIKDGMIWYGGQYLMARGADRYFDDKARRERRQFKNDEDRNRAANATRAAAARDIMQRRGSREDLSAALGFDADGLAPFAR